MLSYEKNHLRRLFSVRKRRSKLVYHRDGQSAICASLNDISKEHTSLQLESRSYIEEMKARIREDIGQHGEKLGDLVRLTKNLHALGEEGRRVAKEG